MADYKYKFSIVTAVYNVELFVAETIESLIAQDIGFKNIQLILVDDGSPDKSGEICDRYAEKYPNITVIHKENGGVSSARNAGLEVTQGKYVNFLDSDDKLTPDTLRKVWQLFESNPDKTDVVSIPIEFFDGRKGEHYLNYKFEKSSRIIDLNEEWHCIQMSAATAFIRSSAIKDLRFDSRLAFAEDAQLVQKILCDKQTIGVEADCRYMYRRRTNGTPSALQNSVENPMWYLPSMKYYHMEIINYALEKCGVIPKFIQYAVMYDMQWRIKRSEIPAGVISQTESEEYLNLICQTIKYIDDDIIMAQKNLFREYKLYALKLKYGKEPKKIRKKKDKDVVFRFSKDAKFRITKNVANIEFIDIKKSVLKIEGFVSLYNLEYEKNEVFIAVNGKRHYCKPIERNKDALSLGEVVLKRIGFCKEIPLEKDNSYTVEIGVNIDDIPIILKRHSFKYFSPITNTVESSYYKKEKWLISTADGEIHIEPATKELRIEKEKKFLKELSKSKIQGCKKHIFLRKLYCVCKRFKRKPLWLISDRLNIAGDNGEAFFIYMRKNHPEINSVFVIDNKCRDYKRMRKIGPVIKPESFKHKLYILLCDYAISSQGENVHFDPFGNMHNFFRDITTGKRFIFLQHGVIHNDLSDWLNRYNKNIFGFVTSAQNEYNSLLEYDYGYTKKQVWLTGIPRFDRLYRDEKNIITVMPTWRKYLTQGWDSVNNIWKIKNNFAESDFYNFYNSLLNNKRLLETAQKYGYKFNFMLHPNLRSAVPLFKQNETVTIALDNINYRDIYAQSNLIITDYSSAVFDFAYLRKPIIYTQFDFDDFFGGNHTSNNGYFDFKRDGFGEVEYDLDSTINRIIEYMENGCKLKDEYRERIDNFFAFSDKNNCERVYKKIMKSKK